MRISTTTIILLKRETFFKAQYLIDKETELENSIKEMESGKGSNIAAKPINLSVYSEEQRTKLDAIVTKHLKSELAKVKKEFENLK